MPAQTVDVTTNGITSKVRAASLAEPAAAPPASSLQSTPEPLMTDVDVRLNCLNMAVKSTATGVGLTPEEFVAAAQTIYDWVTQQKQAAIGFPPTPVDAPAIP